MNDKFNVVLRRIGTEKKRMRNVTIRKTSYLGNILGKEKYLLFNTLLQGRIGEKRRIGQKRNHRIDILESGLK